ncbi:MAG: heparinase II/III family protein, partial [Oscillospiraceae bacterium]
SGNPTIKSIRDYPFCGSEKVSLLIQNTSENDCGGIQYIEPIPIEGGIFNTICFDAKLDGKLKKGLKITIEFLDINKKKIDEFVHYFNKKSSLTTADFALSMQCDAIVYMMTNDIEYAKKAKKQIMFILNDFCQGIEYWKIYDSRPQGSDAYGAVQGGRILSSLMSTYTLISDTFSTAEKSAMLPYLKYFAPYLLDLRDRTELSSFDSQADAGNWQTDMAAGIGFLMMAIPDFPNSDIWLSNANMILKSQLKENVHHDGSWPESIRYHFAALSRFAIYAKVLLNCTGEDWFKNGPLVSMFRYPALMQTPPCKFFDNNISTPNFGDHHLTNGNEFAPFGIYCSDIAKLDTNVADTLYLTWCRAGRPMGHYWGEAVAIENLFFIGSNYTPKENALVLSSTNEFKQAGITIFRNGFNTQNEDYFAIMASPEKVSHGHFDEGSFIIYKNNTPIIIDPGIEGYFDSTKDWYVSSSAHNVVQFERNGGKKSTASPFTIDLETTDYSALEGFNDTARCAKQTSFSHNSKFDSITLEIKNFEGGTHTRCVTFLKNPGIYIIDDNVKDFKGLIRFNLLCATKNAQINGNCVSGIGYENIDLDVVFLGKTPDIKLEKGRCLKMFHCEKKPEATIIRAMGNQGFLTVIFPFSHGDKRMEISEDLNFYILKIGESKVEINKKTHEISF